MLSAYLLIYRRFHNKTHVQCMKLGNSCVCDLKIQNKISELKYMKKNIFITLNIHFDCQF